MHEPDNRESGGGLPRPFVGGESSVSPAVPQSHAGLPRPFVPGQEPEPAPPEATRQATAAVVAEPHPPVAASSPVEPATTLPPITEFLYEEGSAGRARSFTPSVPPLPGYAGVSGPSGMGAQHTPPEPWATGEWQHYDWRAAASLAPGDSTRAEEAWSDLDWDADARHVAHDRGEAVAAALEQVARRVRAGHLSVSGRPGMSDEAAVAAALAALLALKH